MEIDLNIGTKRDIYLAKKDDYTFNAVYVEESKQADGNYIIKFNQYAGYVHNCGPITPHIVQQTNIYENVTQEMLSLFYDDDLKGFYQISKENYDKITELYDNYHKVFVETGRKIKKLIK